MAEIVYTNNQNYTDIANAIRNKGVNGTFKPNEMANAINSIKGVEDASYHLVATLSSAGRSYTVSHLGYFKGSISEGSQNYARLYVNGSQVGFGGSWSTTYYALNKGDTVSTQSGDAHYNIQIYELY